MQELTLTLGICVLTGIVSFMSFSRTDLFNKLALIPYRVKQNNEFYRLFTHALVHADYGHLFFNLYALYGFGTAIEYYIPASHYLLIYIMSAAVASIPAMIRQGNNVYYMSVGASGAVSAVLMIFMFFFPSSELLFFFILPLKGWIAVILFFALEYYMNKRMKTNIAHDAHMVGAAFGILYVVLFHFEKFLNFFHVVFSSLT